MANENWQEDWTAFAQLLEDYLKKGKGEEELTTRFGGKLVKWQGRLTEKNIDDDISPSVTVLLPTIEIAFDNNSTTIDILNLPIATDAKRAWQDAEIGSTVEFTAQFDDAGSLLPPIYVLDVGGGQTAVMIGITEGRVVG